MTNQTPSSDVIIQKPSYNLRKKTGGGDVSLERIQSANNILKDNKIDFIPMAKEYLSNMEDALSRMHSNPENTTALHPTLTKAFMELKANASIFGYALITDLATIAFNLLEDVDHVDEDLEEILIAQFKTFNLVIAQDIKGDGGQIGEAMRKEFLAVRERYLKKQ